MSKLIDSGDSMSKLIDSGDSSDEALGELLGFNIGAQPGLSWIEDSDEDESIPTSQFTPITLPPRCHRLPNVPNEHCFVLNEKGLVPPSLCAMIIKLAAANNTANSFRYITEATHFDADGEKFTVPIASPNPHKLAMLPFNDPNYKYIYRRLKDLLFSDHILDLIVGSNFYDRLVKKSRPKVLPQYGKLNHDRIGDLRSVLKLNPRLRVLRYDGSDDDSFPKHFDAVTESAENGGENYHWSSTLTILLYLNKLPTADSGRTIFHSNHYNNKNDDNNDKNRNDACNSSTTYSDNKVVPGAGDVLIFEHDLMHSGEKLKEGETKFILRTDVMFMTYKDFSEGTFEGDGEGGEGGEGGEAGGGEQSTSSSAILTVKDFLTAKEYEIVSSLGLPESVEGFCKPGREVIEVLIRDVMTLVDETGFLDRIFEENERRKNK